MVISKFSLGFLLLSFLFFSLSGCGSSSGTVASLTVSPTSATIAIGQSQVFTAVAHDSTGKIVSVTPTWSISGGIGTIS